MKNKLFFCVFLIAIIINTTHIHALSYESKSFLHITFDGDLNKYNNVALQNIINDFNNKKININGFILKTIKILNELEKIKDQSAHSSQNTYFSKAMAIIYNNYNSLSANAIKELEKSGWGLEKYINKNFTTDEISVMKSVSKREIIRDNKKIYYYDLIEAFDKLSEKKYISKTDAAIFILVIRVYGNFLPLKYNLDVKNEFTQNFLNIHGWISENSTEIIKNDNAKLLGLLFDMPYLNFYNELLNSKKKTNDNFIVFSSDFMPDDPITADPATYSKFEKDVLKHFDSVLATHSQNYNNKFKKPISIINNGKHAIFIGKFNDKFSKGSTIPLFKTIDGKKQIKDVYTLLDPMNTSNDTELKDTIVHEYLHACQFSYINNTGDDWFLDDEKDFRYALEGTAVVFSDIFQDDSKYKTTLYWSCYYFFKNVAEQNFDFYDPYFQRKSIPVPNGAYSFSTFIYYLYVKHYPSSTKMDFFNTIWTNIQNAQSTNLHVWTGLSKIDYNGTNFLKAFHNFNIDCISLNNGIKNVFEIEDNMYVKINDKKIPYKINPDKFKTLPYDDLENIIIMPCSVAYYVLDPPFNKTHFENSIFSSCSNLDPKFHAVSVLKIWDNGKIEKSNITIQNINDINSGNAIFNYHTIKGPANFNPQKFIFIFSNISSRPLKTGISCSTIASSPDVLNPLYDKKLNLSLSLMAGNDFKESAKGVYNYWKKQCDSLDQEISLLINKTPSNDFVIGQIKEKFKQLNLSMQEAIVAIHDLRYQFYLRKQYITQKICSGSNSTSILEQLKRLKEYLDDINTTLSSQNDKILSVIGSMVADHAVAQLMNVKNPMNYEWSDEENKTNQAMQSVKNKIQTVWKKSSYFFNTNEIGDAYTAVGNPEFEIIFQLSGNKPAPVNIPPNLKNEQFAQNVIYKISDTIKNYNIVNYREYLFSDTCDPMNLKYFSIIKKHDYREEFMPPEPGTPSYFRELNEIAQFRINAHNCVYENLNLLPSDIIEAVSRKFEDFKRRTIDALIIQLHKGNFDLLYSIKSNANKIESKEEMIKILSEALKEIKAIEILDQIPSNDINKFSEIVNEIIITFNK